MHSINRSVICFELSLDEFEATLTAKPKEIEPQTEPEDGGEESREEGM